MPQIFDNITGDNLAQALNQTLSGAKRADFCIGYFNLRGWNLLLDSVDKLSGSQLDEKVEYSKARNIYKFKIMKQKAAEICMHLLWKKHNQFYCLMAEPA